MEQFVLTIIMLLLQSSDILHLNCAVFYGHKITRNVLSLPIFEFWYSSTVPQYFYKSPQCIDTTPQQETIYINLFNFLQMVVDIKIKMVPYTVSQLPI